MPRSTSIEYRDGIAITTPGFDATEAPFREIPARLGVEPGDLLVAIVGDYAYVGTKVMLDAEWARKADWVERLVQQGPCLTPPRSIGSASTRNVVYKRGPRPWTVEESKRVPPTYGRMKPHLPTADEQ